MSSTILGHPDPITSAMLAQSLPEQPGYDAGRGMVIPARMLPGLRRWIEQGIVPGEFLQAVLRNDFRAACERADDKNARILPAYVIYLYNEAPAACWGSLEKVNAWVKRMEDPANRTGSAACS